jgi:hypothetical protein
LFVTLTLALVSAKSSFEPDMDGAIYELNNYNFD